MNKANMRLYRLLNIDLIVLAVGAIVIGVLGFAYPDTIYQSALGRGAGSFWPLVVNAGALIGAIVLVQGALRPGLRSQVAGLYLISGALAVNGAAVLSTSGVGGLRTGLVYVVFAAKLAARGFTIAVLVRASEER